VNDPDSPKRTPGLVGLAVETNVVYYRELNAAAHRVDPAHTATSLLSTIDFEGVAATIRSGDLDALGAAIIVAAQGLERAGADFLVLTTNTGHVAIERVRAVTGLPVLDVRDVVARELDARGVRRCGILSTSATRAERLYEKILEPLGIEVVHPSGEVGARIDQAIFGELVHRVVDGGAADVLNSAADDLRARGVEAVVLACTDMTVIATEVVGSDVIDSTRLHARIAGELAAGGIGVGDMLPGSSSTWSIGSPSES
jgi:aspartate racemase